MEPLRKWECSKCGKINNGSLHTCPQCAINASHQTGPGNLSTGAPGYKSNEVQAVTCIKWVCSHCDAGQFSEDTLLPEVKGDVIRRDNILCMVCGKDNAVYIQEL